MCPLALRQQLGELASGSFVDRGVNVLAFGLPGTGKTHALCAVGHRLMEAGRSVLFAPAYRLVQDLLAAKRDLALPRQLRKLDNYDFLLLDDLGYLPQGAEESEVLFTLIAERYERRSLGITSNLVFSQWEHIFANPMATAAAIDQVVHHSVILEFDVPSYRTGVAQQRSQEREVNRQESLTEPAKVVDAEHGVSEILRFTPRNSHTCYVLAANAGLKLVLWFHCTLRGGTAHGPCDIPFALCAMTPAYRYGRPSGV